MRLSGWDLGRTEGEENMIKILYKNFSIKISLKKLCAYRGQSPGYPHTAFTVLSAMALSATPVF